MRSSQGVAGLSGGRRVAANPVEWDAEHIRALRAHLRMTQEEVAALLGTRQQTISEWEVGKHRPRGTSVAMLTSVAESSGFLSVFVRLEPVHAYTRR